jgi:hypothetical protein
MPMDVHSYVKALKRSSDSQITKYEELQNIFERKLLVENTYTIEILFKEGIITKTVLNKYLAEHPDIDIYIEPEQVMNTTHETDESFGLPQLFGECD